MTLLPAGSRRRLAAAVALVATLAVAVPVLGQAIPGTNPSPDAPAASPDTTDKPGRGPKRDRVRAATTPVTLTGRVGTREDGEGRPEYTLTVDGTVYVLHVGPPWWWGDAHPLAGMVGDTVTVEGDRVDGTNDVDVRTIDGELVREAGRPPWAGGWKAVGERHPGWSAEKAERWELKRAERAERERGRPGWVEPKVPESPAP